MMKRFVLCLLTAWSAALSFAVENYPYRSDYLWITVPDHADWIYRTGETAKVEVEFYKYGIPREGVVQYSVGNDMLASDAFGKVALKNGRATIRMGTRRTPGFRDLRLKMELDGTVYEHHVKVGFSPDQIRPYTKEPTDFISFWQKNIKEMEQFPLTYTKEYSKEYSTDRVDCYLIKLQLNRQGQSVYGYLLYPKQAKKGSCPVCLCPPGAGIKTIKMMDIQQYYAEQGMIRLAIEIHGLDPRLPQATFDDMSRAFNGFGNGYLENGIGDRDTYYMKRVYLALVRSIDLLTSLPEWDGKNVAIQGGSQGGALSIVGAALDPRINLCVVNHPALSDMAGYAEKGRTGGYPHFNRIPGFLTETNMRTMQYYDVVNFARHVKAKVYMTWGFNDNTCPPTTSYAVWNVLSCPKESLITPINEHWTSAVTDHGQAHWIMKHLK